MKVKKILAITILAVSLISGLFAQGQTVTLTAGVPSSIQNVSVYTTGTTGGTFYCYWLVAVYNGGMWTEGFINGSLWQGQAAYNLIDPLGYSSDVNISQFLGVGSPSTEYINGKFPASGVTANVGDLHLVDGTDWLYADNWSGEANSPWSSNVVPTISVKTTGNGTPDSSLGTLVLQSWAWFTAGSGAAPPVTSTTRKMKVSLEIDCDWSNITTPTGSNVVSAWVSVVGVTAQNPGGSGLLPTGQPNLGQINYEIFRCNSSGQILTAQKHLQVDLEPGFYWDNAVEAVWDSRNLIAVNVYAIQLYLTLNTGSGGGNLDISVKRAYLNVSFAP